MSSIVQKQLEAVEKLIIHGEYQEALKAIEQGLKKKDLSKENELFFLVHRGHVLFFLGKVQESLQLSEMALKQSKKFDNASLELCALIIHVLNLRFVGRFDEAVELSEKGLEILSTATVLPAKEIAKRKAQLLIWKAETIFQLGDTKKSLELTEEALILALKSDHKPAVSMAYGKIGLYHLWLNDNKKYEEYNLKSLAVATELGNKFLIAMNYIRSANIKRQKKEYQEALDLFEEAFALSKEVGSTLILANFADLGAVYCVMFQLDKALECYQEALKYTTFSSYVVYADIGLIYFWKYELEKSQEYLLKSMKISEEINERQILPMVLFNLILIALELRKFDQAKRHLTRLEQIDTETGFERTNIFYRFANIKFLITCGNLSELAKAAGLLNEFLQEDDLPSDWKLDALYTLLEIRIKELTLSPTEANLTGAKKQAIRLEVEAEEQQLQWFLANVYRLQSQLALIELDVKEALALLQKAQIIAEEIEVELLKKKIKEDQEKIKQQLNMFHKLQEQKSPLSEIVKLASLETTVKSIAQETVLEERDKKTGQIIEYRKLFTLKM
ncbi:MAG: tetratricopeptide repeat protein [Candidatus Heimdallarchaeota archaeon]